MTTEQIEPAESKSWLKEYSELGISVVLAALGVLVLVDAISLPATNERGLGPDVVPIVIGVALLLVAGLLAKDVLQGGKGEAEGGEDIDLSAPADWRTVLLLAGAFLANVVLINLVGFPISGTVLFWGAAYALGSRDFVRDPLISAGLALVTYFVFNDLLGVSLPGGPLMGVL